MMLSTTSVNSFKKIFKYFAATLFWVAVWQFGAKAIGNATVLPSPSEVFSRLSVLVQTDNFWHITLLSCLRIIIGFLLGTAAGIIFGVLSRISKIIKALLQPLMLLIKTTPVASFIILLFFWLPNGSIPSFISILIVTPIISANLYESFDAIDTGLTETANLYKIHGFTRFKVLYLPTIKSYFLAAFSTSLGLAFKAGIAAEILCTPKNAIGTEIWGGKVYLDTESVFAWTIVVIILSLAFDILFKRLLRGNKK